MTTTMVVLRAVTVAVVGFMMMIMLNGGGVAEAEPQVPCYFLFGDSLVDNGNNNDVANTTDKANYSPYGIDLPDVPRGRFTNGHTIADIVGKYLGFEELIPPFLTARGNETLKGVNYASGGAGIRDETGNTLGVTSLRKQIKHHLQIVSNITTILGTSETPTYLKKCIYSIDIGSNDYLNNYFLPDEYPTSFIYTPEEYAVVLVAQYSEFLQTLYLNGARKVALYGLGEIGCIPIMLNGTECEENCNAAATLFNTQLISLVDYLNQKLPDAMFTYINSRSNSTIASIDELSNYGPCCEVASGEELCLDLGSVCANRSEYIFWDAVHPTQAVNLIYAGAAYESKSSSDAYPVDISQLAEAKLDMVDTSIVEMQNERKVVVE